MKSVSVQLHLLFVYYHWLPVQSEQPHSQVPAQRFSTSSVKRAGQRLGKELQQTFLLGV